jgi:dynein assembly factor 1
MTKKEIQKAALEHSGYSTPSLNDQLYLHYKGYQKIENLEEYVNLKALWLDSNGLQKIENIGHLSSLRCLFLQRNLLQTIENVQGLTSLVQLGKISCLILKFDNDWYLTFQACLRYQRK